MKKAIIIATYNTESELNTFLATNKTYLEVSAVYEDLREKDITLIEDVIERDILQLTK